VLSLTFLQALQKREMELGAATSADEAARQSKAEPFPKEVRMWSVTDVGRWLDTLTLSQYAPAFRDASVDGDFLLELREEDLAVVLGIEHKLHVRKVLLARDKLRPLSEQEMLKKAAVVSEEKSIAQREGAGVPDLDTVFSQARNGRVKRVEDSLNAEFPVDSVDEKGTTLLLLAAQNVNRKLMELALNRGADINHQNTAGNTALHFAMAYDAEGSLAEFLIQKGANDALENNEGLTCYDGI